MDVAALVLFLARPATHPFALYNETRLGNVIRSVQLKTGPSDRLVVMLMYDAVEVSRPI